MDTNVLPEQPILVNFRAPKSTIDLLDQVSRFDNRTRTSVILDLINKLITEKTRDIPLRVQAINDLKTTLNLHEENARDFRLAVDANQAERTARNDSNQVLAPIFSRSSIDLDEDDFGRATKW